jgi:DNA-binding transcriptional ArsR family regulator
MITVKGIVFMKKKADLMLHPVRMRIVQALVEENMTAYGLIHKLKDVPQATMYRQLQTLLKEELIQVIEEKMVKGSVEKVYGAVKSAVNISREEFQAYSNEEHLRFFMTYHTHLLTEVQNYLSNENKTKDFGYGFTPFHLTEEEKKDFFARYKALMEEFSSKEPHEGRTKLTLATIFIPTTE